ncbi:hypothetical protein [Candidatus Lokiarchaeum ossiferum]|uniref:hypothetical protein n=1 Tax=Candidatus Lokiarchaeum ossiferum TaxID=2951803 RepID=UPI00352E8015
MITTMFQEGASDYHMMEGWFNTFGNLAWMMMIIGGILYFGLVVIFAYFIHKDAIIRGSKNPELWILLLIFLNIIGVLIYLVVRNNYSLSQNVEIREGQSR